MSAIGGVPPLMIPTGGEILEYFEPAYQLGMTATPLRQDNKDTYDYFGAPLYTYSLRQGIEDGFLAPYRVHRILTTVDAAGWRPEAGQLDEHGNEIPDQLYTTPNFEKDIVLRQRTEAIAHHITSFLKDDPYAKTIVFCVDQEHAENMRAALSKCNPDLMRQHPDLRFAESSPMRATLVEGTLVASRKSKRSRP